MANEKRLIDVNAAIAKYRQRYFGGESVTVQDLVYSIEYAPTVDAVEVEDVAEMLRVMFDDDCACNYNGNDEWLPCLCKYAETDCPMPKERLGCWIEFVKHWRERRIANENL